MNDVTICIKCEHIILDVHSTLPRCAASPKTDYVTGESKHRFCESTNDGDCSNYKPLPTGHDPQAHEAWGKDGDE